MGAGKGKSKRASGLQAGRSSSQVLTDRPAGTRLEKLEAQAQLGAARSCLAGLGATLDLFTLMGSHAYGLAHADSDLDYRGVYRLSLAEKLGVHGYKDTITLPEGDVVLYELGKFARMLGQGNPNVIEVLFVAPEQQSEVGKLIGENKEIFLSQLVRSTHIGFASSHLRLIEKKKETMTAKKREKLIRHSFRALWQGEELLKTGAMTVKLTAEQINLVTELVASDNANVKREFELVKSRLKMAKTELPAEPDWTKIDALVLQAYLDLAYM